MFIGHFGLGLAGRRLAPRTSLGMLILGAQFLDLLWPVFLLLGFEHVRLALGITKVRGLDFYDYPFSHSLSMAIRWSLAVGLLYYLVRRYRRGAWVVGGLVLSHWILDWVVHRPDLPLWPGGPKYGLGLWNSWVGSISVEVLLFAAGIWLYVRSARARDRVGTYGFWGLMAFLFLGWLAGTFGPLPRDIHQLAMGAMGIWIVVPWAWWADAHREDMSSR